MVAVRVRERVPLKRSTPGSTPGSYRALDPQAEPLFQGIFGFCMWWALRGLLVFWDFGVDGLRKRDEAPKGKLPKIES